MVSNVGGNAGSRLLQDLLAPQLLQVYFSVTIFQTAAISVLGVHGEDMQFCRQVSLTRLSVC